MSEQPQSNGQPPPLTSVALRMGLRFCVIAAAVFCFVTAMDWAMERTDTVAEDISTGMMLGTIALFLLVYALLIAVPFVPGIEIGIALLVLRGAEVAPYVYVATVAGLVLAYAVGQTMSYAPLRRICTELRLKRAAGLIDASSALSPEDRLAVLERILPPRLRPLARPGRYVLLAVLINIPGNGVIGGGGGIALMTGLSRLYSPGWTVLTIALAVLPVPLIVLIWGGSVLNVW